MKEKNTSLIVYISLAVFIILSIFEIYHCPLTIIFGLSCPTCGITRAIISAIQFDFSNAFYYHMLWPIVPIGFIIFALYSFKLIRINKRAILITAYLICSLNLIYYFYRLFSGSQIVYLNFYESLIYKIINLL